MDEKNEDLGHRQYKHIKKVSFLYCPKWLPAAFVFTLFPLYAFLIPVLSRLTYLGIWRLKPIIILKDVQAVITADECNMWGILKP